MKSETVGESVPLYEKMSKIKLRSRAKRNSFGMETAIKKKSILKIFLSKLPSRVCRGPAFSSQSKKVLSSRPA